MIEHKITPGTLDEVCQQCSQLYEGECRAYSMPHSRAERAARDTVFGMECDSPRIKKIMVERHGLKYRTYQP